MANFASFGLEEWMINEEKCLPSLMEVWFAQFKDCTQSLWVIVFKVCGYSMNDDWVRLEQG